jgi:DNA-binding LacI/PurR family transcriptional regulator
MDEPTPPRQRLTLRDLAVSLGVSKTTVSNAFSRPDQLSPGVRARVLEAARAAGYAGPDPMARMLMTRRAGAIGLILPESLPFALDDPVAGELIRGIADACEERRLGLLIVPGGIHAADPRIMADVVVDGFVAYSLPRGSGRLEAALGRGIPVVVVDQPRLFGVATVVVDDTGGAREAARHLLALGHRRFGIVSLPCQPDGYTGPGDPTRIATSAFDVTAARFAGYAEALAEAGLAIDKVPFFECAHGDGALGAAAGGHLFALADRPTAVMAMSDRLAIGVMEAARAAGLAVPDDVSVTGFDDIAAAAHARPALTTVRQELRLKGYAAARLLLDVPIGARASGGSRLETPTTEVPMTDEAPRRGTAGHRPGMSRTTTVRTAADEDVDLPLELVVRRSTAAPAA